MKRGTLVLVCLLVLTLPMIGERSSGSSFVAQAGHMLSGQYCEPCGMTGCLCDPGEIGGQSLSAPKKDARVTNPRRDIDLMSSAGLGVLILLLIVARMRATA